MEKLVVLRNDSPSTIDITCHHDILCSYRNVCSCSVVQPTLKGQKPQYSPATITLLPKETSTAVPAAIQVLPQVKSLKRRGWLTITPVAGE